MHTRTWHLPNLVLFLLAQAVRSYHSMHGVEKRLVYILRSIADPLRHYVGITNDMHGRLEWHNHGPCGHTTNHRPWTLVVSIEFPTERDAVRFEKYLKSGSGRAFTKRHFGPSAGTSRPHVRNFVCCDVRTTPLQLIPAAVPRPASAIRVAENWGSGRNTNVRRGGLSGLDWCAMHSPDRANADGRRQPFALKVDPGDRLFDFA